MATVTYCNALTYICISNCLHAILEREMGTPSMLQMQ